LPVNGLLIFKEHEHRDVYSTLASRKLFSKPECVIRSRCYCDDKRFYKAQASLLGEKTLAEYLGDV